MTNTTVLVLRLHAIRANLKHQTAIADITDKPLRAYERRKVAPFQKQLDELERILKLSKSQHHFAMTQAKSGGDKNEQFRAGQRVDQARRDYQEIERLCSDIAADVIRQYYRQAPIKDQDVLKGLLKLIKNTDKFFDQLSVLERAASQMGQATTVSVQPMIRQARNQSTTAQVDPFQSLTLLVILFYMIKMSLAANETK